ncbi:hypothetical protein A6B39_04970 [Mannheimia granulomatis]|uniref:YdgA family protein n=1 Tax=Mannheimia granulomatis TaxID=85402 RepID=UPI00159E5302|nr:YdgA family protein [Mannheimia granulomatis]QLB14852.1 hypothetical protein A6B39_04970 [Mannheimia granulomatis]
MKLTKIAVSVVAILGVVSVGGSWYTGKQVEEKYQQLITQSNDMFKNFANVYGTKVEIKDVQINRGFFSSDAKYRLEVEMIDGEKLDFIGNDKIHHGPLPLNRLAKFNFVPVLMSMENHIQSPESFKKVLGEKLGSGVANISYSGKAEGEFKFSPIKVSNEQALIEGTPIKMEYSFDQNAINMLTSITLDDLKVKIEDGDFNIQGLSYEIQTSDSQGYTNLGLGKGGSKIKAIEFKSKEGELTQIKDIVAKGDNVLKGDRVVSSAQAEAATIQIAGVDLGKFKMDMLTDFDAKLMNDIMPLLSHSEALENEQIGEMVLELLSKSSKFHINNFALEKANGKFDIALLLNLAQFSPQTMSDLNTLLKAMTSSKFALNVNREYLEDIMRQVAITQEKLTEDEAKVKAEQEVNTIFGSNLTGMTVIDGNNLKSELSINDGKVFQNGRELSEDEVQMALFMIMMGTGSLGK